VPSPRVLSVCIFSNDSRILVARGFDEVKNEHFFRPIGGAVEFGETTAETIRREVGEELGVQIEQVVRIGVLENLFHFDGKPGHEIIFVFNAKFVDKTLYTETTLPIHEEGWVGPAQWINVKALPTTPLYPDGIIELLTEWHDPSIHRRG